jgi:glycerol-1-phosphate dehydrogenase [NAD(P)+]
MPQTQVVVVEDGALQQVPRVFADGFPGRTPMVIADANTWAAAGERVAGLLNAEDSLILPPGPAADMPNVDRVQAALAGLDVTPVAVGAGTINDLVKLAAGRLKRDYLTVGTAASMDGYTAFGASITEAGSKQTFDCPAPRAFVADLDVIANAPPGMAATGYADLLAKVTAGADWIVADAVGAELIDREAWAIIQTPLRGWLADPARVKRHEKPALKNLMDGLVAGGLAMQVTQNSRPASGAEHQFSHLWDMQGHTHHGHPVPHGAKVGIGTIRMAELYEWFLDLHVSQLNPAMAASRWMSLEDLQHRVAALHDVPAILNKALVESTAKHPTAEQLEVRLTRLKVVWEPLRDRLRKQLMSAGEMRQKLASVGAPTTPEEIGISQEQLIASEAAARSIRRRYTLLDLLFELTSG